MSVYSNCPLLPLDLRGWGSSEPVFAEVIEAAKPGLIVEVGSWKGASAIHMAKECERLGLPTKIICVDTWLGSAEFYDNKGDETRYGSLQCVDGYPRVYYQFLSNVIHSQMTERITPMPLPSLVAAQVLKKDGVKPDVVYLDASHSFDDVFLDITNWWNLLRPEGFIFGDDYDPTWKSVQRAVQAFSAANAVNAQIKGRHWVMQKRNDAPAISLEDILFNELGLCY